MGHALIELEWPRFGSCDPTPAITLDEYAERLAATRRAMDRRGLTHLVVYGDREHFANLHYLTGLDPRFEEAIVVVAGEGTPLLVVGNEGVGYLGVSPPWRAGAIRHARYRPFSLPSQPREGSPRIRDVFAGEGIGSGARVGCVGWKLFGDRDEPAPLPVIEVPAFLVDALRELCGTDAVVSATEIFMDPEHGLRARCSATDLAILEYAGIRASEAVRRVIHGVRDGIVDFELARCVEYSGEPLSCHLSLSCGEARATSGHKSPSGATILRGDTLSIGVGYRGGNVCRVGWVARDENDLPPRARDYVSAFAGPYFEAVAAWLGRLRIGASGDALHRSIDDRLPREIFGIELNAGHLIHMDEWVSSPVYPGSEVAIASGMAMQVDIIPRSPTYVSTRMEDGLAVADAALQAELRSRFPACLRRCLERRAFMRDSLGLDVGDDILPLSNMPAIVPPFFMRPTRVLALT